MDRNGTSTIKSGKNQKMKHTVLISSTILATITLLELGQASTALSAPDTIQPTVNSEVEVLLRSDISARQRRRRRRRGCTDGGQPISCPGFVMPEESQEQE
jgi:hypothetical protein